MKKAFLSLFAFLTISLFLFCSCDPQPQPQPEDTHVHTFADAWCCDATHHWLAATCEHTDEVKDFALHSYGPETDLGNGVTSKTCKLCGYKLVSKPGCTVLLTLMPNNGEEPVYLAGNAGETVSLPLPVKTAVGFTDESLRGSAEYQLAFWRSGSTVYEAGSSYTFGSSDDTLEAVYCVHVAVVRGDSIPALADFFNGKLDYTTFKISYVSPFMSDSDIVGVFSAKPDSALTVPSSLVATGCSLFDLDGNFIDLSSKTGAEDMILVSLPDVVELSFEPNSASGQGVVKNVPYGKTVALPSDLFEKEDCVFNGWNTSATGDGTSYSDRASFTSDATLYAQWIPCFTISFDANGGDGTMNYSTVRPGENFTLPKSSFTRTGYVFTGWNTASDGTGSAYDDRFSGQFTSDVTLYAQWQRIFAIVYNANGGDGSMIASIAREGEYITLPAPGFTKYGYVFADWNSRADGTGASVPDRARTVFITDVTLFAQWIKLHTITFDANGGDGTMDDLTDIDERVNTTLPASVFTKSGYVFKNWNTASDGTGTTYSDCFIGKFTSDMTLYAQWQVAHTITYNANGGSGTMDSSIVLETEQFSLPTCTFTKTDYCIKAWNTAADGSGTSYPINYKGYFSTDTTLYAQWTRIGSTGPAGGIIFYDCDEDNASGNADGLVSTECGWRFLEATPDTTIGSLIFGYFRTDPAGDNLYVNETVNYTEGTTNLADGKCTGTIIGTGANNTKKLAVRMGNTAYEEGDAPEMTSEYAAKVASDYVYGGYDDWFLPSIDELDALYTNLKEVGKPLLGTHWYWSSSEAPSSPTLAWSYFAGNNPGPSTGERNYFFHVCFVRSFI